MADDYINRKATVKALCFACRAEQGKNCEAKDICSLYCRLENLPAADVRPVVLCKDCRHRDPEDHKCDCGQLERAGCVFPVDDDYFCAYGER